MKIVPSGFDLPGTGFVSSSDDNHIQRNLSNMQGQYPDTAACDALLTNEDRLPYEVYDLERPEVEGELLYWISIVHPCKASNEYHMTKGYSHTVLETGVVYYCLKGRSYMVKKIPEHLVVDNPRWQARALR